MKTLHVLAALVSTFSTAFSVGKSWKQAVDASPEWYRSTEASTYLKAVLGYQFESGGWPKNHDMAEPPTQQEKEKLAASERKGTIDNGATYRHIEFLARYASATGSARAEESVVGGIKFLIEAQYPNGGWPMYYPLLDSYHDHVTYNDNAMVGVLNLFLDIVKKKDHFGFIEPELRQQVRDAFDNGIDCILRSQVVNHGVPTVWCAQHDAKTLAPAPARAFEPASLSGAESVQILKLLLRVNPPTLEIRRSIEGAVDWFESNALHGLKLKRTEQGKDRVLVADASAPRLWARFYELETYRPIFAGRDRQLRYDYMEIEPERRAGYLYFGPWPEPVLQTNYPAWRERWIGPDGRLLNVD